MRDLTRSIFSLLFLATTISACSDDFSVSGESTQVFDLEGIDQVVVQCYCESGIVVRRDADAVQLRIRVKGTHSSVGYHGKQLKPKSVSDSLLRFQQTTENGVMTLTSSEYLRGHHAYLIDELEIFTPREVGVRLESVEPPIKDGVN